MLIVTYQCTVIAVYSCISYGNTSANEDILIVPINKIYLSSDVPIIHFLYINPLCQPLTQDIHVRCNYYFQRCPHRPQPTHINPLTLSHSHFATFSHLPTTVSFLIFLKSLYYFSLFFHLSQSLSLFCTFSRRFYEQIQHHLNCCTKSLFIIIQFIPPLLDSPITSPQHDHKDQGQSHYCITN